MLLGRADPCIECVSPYRYMEHSSLVISPDPHAVQLELGVGTGSDHFNGLAAAELSENVEFFDVHSPCLAPECRHFSPRSKLLGATAWNWNGCCPIPHRAG